MSPATLPLVVGATVRLPGYAATGTVLRVHGTRVDLRVGHFRLCLPCSEVEVVAAPPRKLRATVKVTPVVAPNFSPEIDLHGFRAEEAMAVLDVFLDRALRLGYRRVKIIHGKGTGTLRQATHRHLRQHPRVEDYDHHHPFSGGTGVTWANLY